MEGYDHPVGGGVDVGLQVREAEVHGVAECGQAVLRVCLGTAAVGEGEGPRMVQVGVEHRLGHRRDGSAPERWRVPVPAGIGDFAPGRAAA